MSCLILIYAVCEFNPYHFRHFKYYSQLVKSFSVSFELEFVYKMQSNRSLMPFMIQVLTTGS